MKGIFHQLPSLASDYSGAIVILLEMGGLMVLCDASGCAGTSLILDDPRFYSAPQRFYCAYLNERDIVLGFDEKLVTKIQKTHELVGGKFIATIGTPVPAIVGTDFRGISKQLEKRTGIPAIGIDTNGMECYESGQTKTYKLLLKRFDQGNSSGNVDVHVIGATTLDMWDVNQTDDMLAFLRACGAEKPVVWGIDSSIEEISEVSGSKLNVAVSVSALPIVRELKKKYGTPYLIGFPVGERAAKEWKEKVSCILKGKEAPMCEGNAGEAACGRALVLGEQVASENIRLLLEKEFAFADVDVASYFKLDSELKRENDRYLVEEDDLAEFVSGQPKYDLVIGDPFLLRMLPYKPENVIMLPHTAISGRVFWDQSPNCFGEKGSLFFEEALQKYRKETE